jgi:hypothetical protein
MFKFIHWIKGTIWAKQGKCNGCGTFLGVWSKHKVFCDNCELGRN